MLTRDVQCRHGIFRQIETDKWVSRSLRELGEYSEDEIQAIKIFIDIIRNYKKGPIEVVEAGAYIGDITVPMSRFVDHIHAFEPQEEVRDILQYNLEQNGVTNVTVWPYALGDVNQTIYFDPEQDPDSPGSKMMGAQAGTPVQMFRLDDLKITPDFIKADVEGMEIAMLAGAIDTVTNCKPILFCECDTVHQLPGQPTLEDAYRYFGYSMKRMIFPMYKPDNFNKNPENNFGMTASFMMFGAPCRT